MASSAIWDKERDAQSFKTGSEETAERKENYIEWLLTPKEERIPQTKQEFADVIGVSTQTLRNYTRDPKVQADLIRRGRAINKVEKAQDVLDSLYKMATGNTPGGTPAAAVSAAKVWLDWTEQQISEGASEDLTDLSRTELLALVERVYDVVDAST